MRGAYPAVWASLGFLALTLSCSAGESVTLSLNPTPEDGEKTGGETSTGGMSSSVDDAGDGGEVSDSEEDPRDECSLGCPEERPYCLNGACAECSGDADCESDESCELTSGLCRRFCSDSDPCEGEDFCSPSGICLECAIDADCAIEEEKFCSPEGRCVDCMSDADCVDSSEEQRCMTSVHECVECLSNSDCTTGTCDVARGECSGSEQ